MMSSSRIALVTGAGSGIGRSIAKLLAREGWRVAVVDVHGDAVETLAREIGDDAVAISADVSNPVSVQSAFETVAERFDGTLDLLVNCAGLLYTGDFEDEPQDHLIRMLAVNNLGPALCCRAALRLLRKSAQLGRRPAVVNLSSASSIIGIPSMGVYSASKFWVRGFTEALASEWARHGIAVRSVVPSFVNTPMVQGGKEHLLMRRLGIDLQPDEVAKQVLIAARRGPLHRPVSLSFRVLLLISHVVPACAMRFGLAWLAGYWPTRKGQ
jgi:NAD(P)-dependent dehydrogenase (short-subunit alcohol dehydrogenase family)